jgi:hypothetical protein
MGAREPGRLRLRNSSSHDIIVSRTAMLTLSAIDHKCQEKNLKGSTMVDIPGLVDIEDAQIAARVGTSWFCACL